MSAVLDSLPDPLPLAQLPARSQRPWWTGGIAALAWAATGLLTLRVPNQAAGFSDWVYTDEFGIAALAVAALLFLLALAGTRTPARLRTVGPWLIALGVGLGAWELVTAKLAWLPTPFFAPPTALAEVVVDDWRRLGDSTWNSLKLLATGVAWGAATGFVVGVSIGWSRAVGYWVHPLIRFIGPVPASALLPLAFFVFPSSHAAAVFLIALATGFPVAVLTWSGVAGVNRNYYDVARTLGASNTFLVLRVAIPAALPQVFVGLFMGLGAAFSILITAEMMGVKSGLGWYLSWAQGWAAYANMYTALIVMALMCSGLITLLFVLRERVLSWQKGTLKW
ncbi:ABC transporter permease subunit [Paucibacter sp. R3-3]|uniref:ABC transporter permease subunit n=1 Tax=Roseateles agri TaxID=3098619 RepID=A0ABU5DPT0_9BURK|nr:ABC transporter permease subunit [Paucibacter sp. R3-3]MDY0747738.1 ABC transporter permease subunit [Paucibacter sp. R3-3]